MSMDDFECDDFEKTLKIIVVGNGSVGKTSMTTRYTKGRYTDNYKKTIGVDFMEKRLELRDMGEAVHLMIWDTAGQEEFGALTSRYYKGAGAVIYVFSTIDRESFDALPRWQRKVEEECGRICHVLVQNKIDLEDDAAMTRGEVEDMADFMRIKHFRACVQDNVNVKEVFEYLCRQFLRHGTRGGGDSPSRQAVADITTLGDMESGSRQRKSSRSRSSSQSPSHSRGSPKSDRRYRHRESSGNSEEEDEREVPRRRSRSSPRPSRRSVDEFDDREHSRDRERARRSRDKDCAKERGWDLEPDRDRGRDSDRDRREEEPKSRCERGNDGRRSRSGFHHSDNGSSGDDLDGATMRDLGDDQDIRSTRDRRSIGKKSSLISSSDQMRYASPPDVDGDDHEDEEVEKSFRTEQPERFTVGKQTLSSKDDSSQQKTPTKSREDDAVGVTQDDKMDEHEHNRHIEEPPRKTSSAGSDRRRHIDKNHGSDNDDDDDEPTRDHHNGGKDVCASSHEDVRDGKLNEMQPVEVDNHTDFETQPVPQRASIQASTATESGRIQPSKRRTNGKKKNPLLHKIGNMMGA